MCKTILEKDIHLSDIIAAPANHARRWYRELYFIVENEQINDDVKITFSTINGYRIVSTQIVAVIENYVKIRDDVIIPLSSISNVDLKESVITIKDDNKRFSRLLFILLLVLISLAVIFFVRLIGKRYKINL